jgi:hypothetical protein
MSKLSRRSVVSSAAALPVLAAPAVASALPTGADIELQRLGVRLLAINRRLASLEADPNSTDSDLKPVLGAQVDVVPKILAQTATTIDGLAVQVVACIAGCREIWDSEEGDGALDTERPFIEAVARYAGVRHPARNVKPWTSSPDAYKPPQDPIFAAIAAFKSASEAPNKAFAAVDEAAGRFCETTGTSYSDALKYEPAVKALNDAFELAAESQAVERNALLETVPTTAEGLATLVAFVVGSEYLLLHFKEAYDTSELSRFLTTVARSASTLAGLPASTCAPATV